MLELIKAPYGPYAIMIIIIICSRSVAWGLTCSAESPKADSEATIIRDRWSNLNATLIEIPFNNILQDGEKLVTDGSVNYVPRIQEIMKEAHREYVKDGKARVIRFPPGTFRFPPETPSVICVSGVGFRGAGKVRNSDGTCTYLTKFMPAKTLFSTNPSYLKSQPHKDIIIDCVEIDCSEQTIQKSISGVWYVYKAIYVERVSNWWINDVYAHDSLGTLFGLDYVYPEGIYFIDCHAKGSGRAAKRNESGPGAGFGITSGSSHLEPCKFVACVAESCKTGGFYFEIRMNKVENPSGYSILNSEAYACSFGVDDQGVHNLVIEDCKFYRNSAYGIRRGAVNTGEIDGKKQMGAGCNGRIGDLICRRSKIYANGDVENHVLRSSGISYTEKCQVQGVNESCQQIFEDCEIFNNRGYGVSNTYSVPRYLILKGRTRIYNNGGSGIHFRQGVDKTETVTLASEGDNVEIFNNGICGDESLLGDGGGSATGVYGDGITLSVNSVNNKIGFRAYGNKSRALAFRPYVGNAGFRIVGGVYSGDWTGQRDNRPFLDEIGASNYVLRSETLVFNDMEQYQNFAWPGVMGPANNISVLSDEGKDIVVEKPSANLRGANHFRILIPPSPDTGSVRTTFVDFGTVIPKGTVPLNTMLMNSFSIKTNKDVTVRAGGDSKTGSLKTEYSSSDPLCRLSIDADKWRRIDMANSCLSKMNSPGFILAFVDYAPSQELIILIKDLMCIDKPDTIQYFGGATRLASIEE